MVPVLERLQRFKHITAPFQPELNRKDNYIGIRSADGEALCKQLHGWGFPNCTYTDEVIQINLDQPDLALFFDLNDFGERVEPDHRYKNLIILTPIDDKFYAYDCNANLTLVDLIAIENNFSFQNVWEYFLFLDFLRRQDYQENKPFYFVDHYDDSRSQFVFISPKKEGKLVIPFAETKPIFPYSQSLKPRFDSFRAAFEEQNKHLPKFIKYELFNVLSKVGRDVRMITWIENLPDILHTAHQNFEVYLHDLSLDKLKSEYQKSQEEYFTKLRELLGKLTTQIIAFPISITATAFATYKAPSSDQPNLTNILLWLIIIAFLVFTSFTVYLLKIQRFDIDELEANFVKDFDKLAKNKFFENPANANDKTSFDESKGKVDAQFRRVKTAGSVYFYLQTFFNALFIAAIVFQITKHIWWAIGISVASIFALGGVYFYINKQVK